MAKDKSKSKKVAKSTMVEAAALPAEGAGQPPLFYIMAGALVMVAVIWIVARFRPELLPWTPKRFAVKQQVAARPARPTVRQLAPVPSVSAVQPGLANRVYMPDRGYQGATVSRASQMMRGAL